MVIEVPPVVGPEVGLMLAMVGAGIILLKALTKLAVPPEVVTAMLLAPAVPAGVTAVIDVDDTTTTLVAATPPTVTLVAPVKLVPVMVMAVPPRVEPEVGLIPEIVGGGVMLVNAPGLLAVPPGVVTVMACAPAVPAGVTAVTEVVPTTFTLVAATPPTVTLVVPVKLVPVMVMVVPPRVEPDVGLTVLMVGTAGAI